jgi:hypothetical protein
MGLFRAIATAFQGASTHELVTRPGFRVDIVGESNYHDAFLAILGGYSRQGYKVEARALLKAEPHNPHDANAVAVLIAGRKVGYLARESAAEFRRQLPDVRRAACMAQITGGWRTNQHDSGNFGVRLNLIWPPQIAA